MLHESFCQWQLEGHPQILGQQDEEGEKLRNTGLIASVRPERDSFQAFRAHRIRFFQSAYRRPDRLGLMECAFNA